MSCRFSGAKHIHISIKTEALKSLEKIEETLCLIKEDSYQWKWAIIILHNCVQIFMTFALKSKGLNNVAKNRVLLQNLFEDFESKKVNGVYSKKIKKGENALKAFEIKCFNGLYEEVKKQVFPKIPFKPTEDHDKALVSLNKNRNNLIHFFPYETPLWIEGMPNNFLLIIDVLKSLINAADGTIGSFSDDEKKIVSAYIESIECKLKELENE